MIVGRFEIIPIFYIFFGILEKYSKGKGIAFDITTFISKITKLKLKMQKKKISNLKDSINDPDRSWKDKRR